MNSDIREKKVTSIELENPSPNSSLWVRSLRQLFKEGKPASHVVALTIEINAQERFSLGLVQHTSNNRLLFWPALPTGKNIFCYVKSLRIANIYMPPIDPECGDYIYFVAYFSPSTSDIDQIPSHIYPTDSKMTDQVEGWNKKHAFYIAPTRFQIANKNIYIASSCPPGNLRMDVSLGFPRT